MVIAPCPAGQLPAADVPLVVTAVGTLFIWYVNVLAPVLVAVTVPLYIAGTTPDMVTVLFPAGSP